MSAHAVQILLEKEDKVEEVLWNNNRKRADGPLPGILFGGTCVDDFEEEERALRGPRGGHRKRKLADNASPSAAPDQVGEGRSESPPPKPKPQAAAASASAADPGLPTLAHTMVPCRSCRGGGGGGAHLGGRGGPGSWWLLSFDLGGGQQEEEQEGEGAQGQGQGGS